MDTIVVYRARDGRWGYCPIQVRHWTAFAYLGTYPTEGEALAAALADRTVPKGSTIKVEGR